MILLGEPWHPCWQIALGAVCIPLNYWHLTLILKGIKAKCCHVPEGRRGSVVVVGAWVWRFEGRWPGSYHSVVSLDKKALTSHCLSSPNVPLPGYSELSSSDSQSIHATETRLCNIFKSATKVKTWDQRTLVNMKTAKTDKIDNIFLILGSGSFRKQWRDDIETPTCHPKSRFKFKHCTWKRMKTCKCRWKNVLKTHVHKSLVGRHNGGFFFVCVEWDVSQERTNERNKHYGLVHPDARALRVIL